MSEYVEKEDHEGGDDDNEAVPVGVLIFVNYEADCVFLIGRRINCHFYACCEVRNCRS
jgi:hypothetical protein